MDSKGSMISENQQPVFYQNVVIMRHGERLDNVDPMWASTAVRPWDAPLAELGRVRVFQMGQVIQQCLKFPVHRIFVSPFLRCVQSVVELIVSLSTIVDDPKMDSHTIDPSKVKVSIEYGLCEMINNIAIRRNVEPKDGIVSFDRSMLEAMLPSGTLDINAEKVYNQVPEWGEPRFEATTRYVKTIKDLADKYPNENLLLITHGEAICAALKSFKKDIAEEPKIRFQYCGYVELKRPIFEKDHLFTSGEFDVVTKSGQTGVTFSSLQDSAKDIGSRFTAVI